MVTTPHQNILRTIGNTPLVHLGRISTQLEATVYAKIERMNPGGSAKDRVAASMLLQKVYDGELSPGRSVVVESSSGNLAIGLAQVCRYFNMRFICVVDSKTPSQTISLLEAYGASVDIVDKPDPDSGEFLPARLRRVRELADRIPNAYWPNQYANPLNPKAHENTMREIAQALNRDVDYLLCAVSTTGTMLGCANAIRELRMDTVIVAVDAVGSVLFTEDPPQYRLIPGYGASIRPPLLDTTAADKTIHVTDWECVVACRALLRAEAILAGGSAGATVAALTKLSPSIPENSTCVLVFPDGGDRYLDTIYSDAWVTKHFGAAATAVIEGGASC